MQKKCHEPINRHTLPSARAVVLIEASPNVISGNVTDCASFQSLRIAYAKHGVTRPADGWSPKNSLTMSAGDDLKVTLNRRREQNLIAKLRYPEQDYLALFCRP